MRRLLDAWRKVRRLRLHWRLAIERHRATREALRTALELLAETSRALDRAREQNRMLREELRRYTARQVQDRAA